MSVPVNVLRFAGTWSIAQRYSQFDFVVSPLTNTSYVYVGVVDITGGADPSIPNPLWSSMAVDSGGIDSVNGLTDPALQITSTDASVGITTVAPNSINLAVSGGGGGGFTTQYPDIWQGSPPTTLDEAVNRLSMILYGRTAVVGRLPQTTANTKVLLTANGQGSFDAIITKQTTDGDPVWVARIGGSVIDVGRGVDIDTLGNVYVSCNCESNPITILNSDGTIFGTLANAGTVNDAFIVKYDTNGFAQWATRIAGSTDDVIGDLSVDSLGNVYVNGDYASNPLTIFNSNGTTFGTLANAGGRSSFVVKYNTNGFGVWATRIDGSGGGN